VQLVFGPDGGGTVLTLARAANGIWGSPVPVNASVTATTRVPVRLALGSAGALFVAWVHTDGVGNEQLYLSQHPAGGEWTSPVQVHAPPEGFTFVGVGLAADTSSARLVSTSCDGTVACQVLYHQCTDAGCAASETIASVASYRYGVPEAAVDLSGQVYALFWSFPPNGSTPRLLLTRRFTNGTWNDLVELDVNLGGNSAPVLAQGGGNIAAAWNAWLGSDDGHAIWAHIWQVGFLPGQLADLAVATDDIQFGQLYEAAGRFYLPVDVTVHNNGTSPAFDVPVRLQHGRPGQPTLAVTQDLEVDVAAASSTRLSFDWDVTAVMGRLDLLVTVDPDDRIPETMEDNNQATATTVADANPRIRLVRSSYKPGTFLLDVSLPNTFQVQPDWNGDLPGTQGVAPYSVTFELNGEAVQVPVGSPEEGAGHTYDMGKLKLGANQLRLTATDGSGRTSRATTIELTGIGAPQWLAANTSVVPEPPDATYDKLALYQVHAPWPATTVDGTSVVPGQEIPFLAGRFGPVLFPGSLQLEFRSNGRLDQPMGTGRLSGYLADQVVIGPAAPFDVEGTLNLTATSSLALGTARVLAPVTGHILALENLTGSLQITGTVASLPLRLIADDLPFLAQSALGLNLDTSLHATESESGQLDWVPQVLNTAADVQGIMAGSDGANTYMEGGVGGQPRHRLGLASGDVYTKSYAAHLFAWATEHFWLWEKSWETSLAETGTSEPVTMQRPVPVPGVSPVTETAVQPVEILPTGVYAYADPALARRADDDILLIYVHRSGLTALNLAGFTWDGISWIELDQLTHGNQINVQPAAAFAGAAPIVVWTRVTTPVVDTGIDPHSLLRDTEIVSMVGPFTSTTGLTLTQVTTDNGAMDLLPAVRSNAGGTGDVLAMWLHDQGADYPLFSDESTRSLTVTVMASRWNGTAWSTPTIAIEGVSTREAPQFAYRGDEVVLAWSHDRDGNPATITDTEIRVATWTSPTVGSTPTHWAEPVTPTFTLDDDDGTLADLSPRVVIDGQGRATVAWRRVNPGSPDQLWYALYDNAGWTGPYQADIEVESLGGLRLVATPDDNVMAVWRALSSTGMDLWYSVLDQDHLVWSPPKQLTDDSLVEGDYDVVVNDGGEAVAVYAGRHIVSGTQTIAGNAVLYPRLADTADLHEVTSAPVTSPDLTVTDLVVTPPNPSPGSTARVSGTLVNDGNLVVDPAYIVFRADGDDISSIIVADPLAPGAHATFESTWDVSEGQSPHFLQAVADPEDVIDESDETNNVIDLIVSQPDLQVAWQTTDFSADAITVTLGVVNTGAIAAGAPFDVELRAGSVTGAAYAAVQIGDDLIRDQEIAVQFIFEDVSTVPANALATYAVVDTENDVIEANEENNTRRVDVPRLPDLAVGSYDLEGAPSQIVTVHNLGPIGAGSFRIAVYRGDEGQEKLFEINVAQLASGATAQLPLTMPAGTLPLIVRVDPDDLVVEADESNNLVSRTVHLWPRWFLPLIGRQ
jgi:hypothetical protein